MKSHPLAAFYQWTVIVGTKSFMCTHKHTLRRLMDCDLLNVRRLIIASYECWASIIINNQLLCDVDCYHRSHVFVYLAFGTSSCCFPVHPPVGMGRPMTQPGCEIWIWITRMSAGPKIAQLLPIEIGTSDGSSSRAPVTLPTIQLKVAFNFCFHHRALSTKAKTESAGWIGSFN